MRDTQPMARKRPKPLGPPSEEREGGQVNFRANAELWRRLQDVAAALGLDIANLSRMVILENLHRYEARVAELRAAEGPPAPPG